MNKTRRSALSNAIELLYKAKEVVENVSEEEQEAYDNLPEGIQCSERGDVMYENIDELSEASDNIDEIIDALHDIIDK